MADLVPHTWTFYSSPKLESVASGVGYESLIAALPDGECGIAAIVVPEAQSNILLQWKGPNAGAMAKNKCNGCLGDALKNIMPNKGYIEVLTKKPELLTHEAVYDRWRPGSGSKVIDD